MRIVLKKGGRDVGHVDVDPTDPDEDLVEVSAIVHEERDVQDLLESAILENSLGVQIMGGSTPASLREYPEGILSVLKIVGVNEGFDFTWPPEIPLPVEEDGTVH